MSLPSLSPAILERKTQIEAQVTLTSKGPRSLRERMDKLRIPGISMAIINDYQIEWASGYGVRERGKDDPVDTATLFQACSISKAVTAIAILRLVEQGHLALDRDVHTWLKSWKIPASDGKRPVVTIRQLLSHTAGISAPWFAGYHRAQDIPTLSEVLNGEQPSNTPGIEIISPPGEHFRYSGGGYCILQQLLIDVMKQPFPTLMRELVLDPAGMSQSTYEQPLPATYPNVASGHRVKGQPVAGNWYVYPEMAAAGLWTTPSDLARLALELQLAISGKADRLLSPAMVQALLTPQSQGDSRGDMGLGIFVQGTGPRARFGHPGDNAGFTSLWLSLMHDGRGCVVMTNSDKGWPLQAEVLDTLARVYAWPNPPSISDNKDLSPENASDSTITGEKTPTTSSQSPRSGFTDVDKNAIPATYIELLDAQQHMAFVQLYKQRARVLLDLQPGLHVLDAGAGIGEDAQAFAALVGPTGKVVGMDLSQAMVEVARKRNKDASLPLSFVQGNIHALPFADNTFDRCYADKTFEHLPDPKCALAELIRVTKPGGLLVTVDPDHETQVLDSPYPNITRRFLRFRNDGMRQPGIAHRMYALFKESGLVDVRVEPLTRVTTDYETFRPVAHFTEGMRSAQQQGLVTEEEASLWIAAMEEAIQAGRFFHAMTSFITRGQKAS